MRVLVVDDAIFMRNSIRIILEKNKIEVVGEAENGQIALEKYQQLKPDLVTMDVTMAEVDGLEGLKLIREYDPKAIVVMMSAMGQESIVKEAILAGAKAFIVKPFKEEHVIKTLRQFEG
ncbi:MAG: response regulator [Chitinophagales bacterium]